ncbi:Sterol 26-hydroxylase, mitochondrial [Acipenser ruthenus]|uniref:Sterol 26-hydroxylase, mitochondrial n=1 Tax=Acipenser ruthenus TaxID=7906 RepID=A0A444V2Q3_ACIRT|nr:Sterol 26-hydroxylase, mitochondrial [Acipenser ruthenus]
MLPLLYIQLPYQTGLFLFCSKGTEWYRIRSALNPKMLKLREVSAYAPVVNEVVTDLLHRIYRLREQSPDGTAVQNLAGELYKFGFEGISSILFDARLGCLDEEIPEDTQKFIRAVGDMLALSETVLFFPKWTRSILPYWKRFVSSWDDISDVAKMLIDRKVKEIHQKTEKGETVEGMYLTYLLSSNKLSLSDIYTSLTELLLGGVDTTSNTMSWTLYHLARAPAVQTRLYREIAEVCPGRRIPTAEHLSQMHYMKAVIKETLR